MSFIEEFTSLEEQFSFLQEGGVNTLPFYRSLLARISEYAHSSSCKDSLEVLSTLYKGVLSKICRLNASLEPSFISDVPAFLSFVMQDLQTIFQQIEHKSHREFQRKQITFYNEEYKKHLSPKIEEANHFIKLLAEEIHTINSQLDDHIQTLIKEIETLKKAKQQEEAALRRKQEELRRALPLKMLFSTLNVGTQALGFLGSAGKLAGGLLDAGLGVGKSFLPSSSKIEVIKSIPESVNHAIGEINDYMGQKEEISFQGSSASYKLEEHLEEKLKAQAVYFNQNTGEWVAFQTSYHKIEQVHIQEEILNTLEKEALQSSSSREQLKKILEKAQVAANVASAGIELYQTYKANQSQMDELSQAIEATKEELKQLANYQQKISRDFVLCIANVKQAVQDFQGALEDKSSVRLDIEKWNIKKYLMDVKYEVHKLTQGFAVEPQFKLSLEKMEGALETVLQLYDRIQNFQDQMILAKYMADLSSASLIDRKENSILQPALSKLENILFYNLALERYTKVMQAIQAWAFPFSSFLMEELESLPVFNEALSQEDMVKQMVENLGILDRKIKESYVMIQPLLDKKRKEAWFKTGFQGSAPFFTWNYVTYPSAFHRLFKGQEVIFKASLPINALPALKFDEIGLEISHCNSFVDTPLQEMLKNYYVSVTHLGESHYKYEQSTYTFPSREVSIQHSFEKDERTQEPIGRNEVYNKLKRGSPLLSPYAFWSMKIMRAPVALNLPVENLYYTFKDNLLGLQIHLTGHGWYVDEE